MLCCGLFPIDFTHILQGYCTGIRTIIPNSSEAPWKKKCSEMMCIFLWDVLYLPLHISIHNGKMAWPGHWALGPDSPDKVKLYSYLTGKVVPWL